MPATPASPPPPGSGSFTLTPRQAQSNAATLNRKLRHSEPERDQDSEEGAGSSDGTRSGIISLHTSIYLFVSRTCGPLPEPEYRISHTGDSGETCPRRLSRFPRWH